MLDYPGGKDSTIRLQGEPDSTAMEYMTVSNTEENGLSETNYTKVYPQEYRLVLYFKPGYFFTSYLYISFQCLG